MRISSDYRCIPESITKTSADDQFYEPGGKVIQLTERYYPVAFKTVYLPFDTIGAVTIIRDQLLSQFYEYSLNDGGSGSYYRLVGDYELDYNDSLNLVVPIPMTAKQVVIDSVCSYDIITIANDTISGSVSDCSCEFLNPYYDDPFCEMDSTDYNEYFINDPLNLIEQDSVVSLARDTVLEERNWNIYADVIPDNCPLDSIRNIYLNGNNTIQLVFLIDYGNDGDIEGINLEVMTSDDIANSIPTRYKNYVRDSVFFPNYADTTFDVAVYRTIERFRRPLPGDPLFEMRVVGTLFQNDHIGGMFGCSRGTSPTCQSTTIEEFHQYPNRIKIHGGMDMYAALNTEIFSMYSGTVERIYTYDQGDLGIRVRLMHPTEQTGLDNIIYTYYTHLSDIEDDIELGNFVKQGQKLGLTGNTGNASEIEQWRYHSHIVVYVEESFPSDRRDPRPYFYTQFDINGNHEN